MKRIFISKHILKKQIFKYFVCVRVWARGSRTSNLSSIDHEMINFGGKRKWFKKSLRKRDSYLCIFIYMYVWNQPIGSLTFPFFFPICVSPCLKFNHELSLSSFSLTLMRRGRGHTLTVVLGIGGASSVGKIQDNCIFHFANNKK